MTTRDRLDRRRSPLRLVLVLVASMLALLGIAAAVALAALPPVLAETPRERVATGAREVLRAPVGSIEATAEISVDAGWVVLGVGPFLDESSVSLISPDDAYRVELALFPAGTAATAGTASRSMLPTPTGPDSTVAATTSPTAAADEFTELLAAHDVTEALAAADWNVETLASGYHVRWTEVVPASAETGVVLAVLTSPDTTTPGELVLIASMPASDAPAYRTVTADLLTAATLGSSTATSGSRP